MMSPQAFQHVQTVVIGGGQAGLSVGYHLARRGLPFVAEGILRRVRAAGEPPRKAAAA